MYRNSSSAAIPPKRSDFLSAIRGLVEVEGALAGVLQTVPLSTWMQAFVPSYQPRTSDHLPDKAGAGFRTTQIQSLQPHYARTLDCWAANLQANREAAIGLTSPETYDMYMHYVTGCADRYRCGKIDVVQISLAKDAA